MEVICEVMELKQENRKDYINLHNNTWPELVKALRDSGFLEEYIFILKNIVILFMKCENFEKSKSKLAQTDIYKKWTSLVRKMLLKHPAFFESDDLLLDLEPVWRLDCFDEEGFLKTKCIHKKD